MEIVTAFCIKWHGTYICSKRINTREAQNDAVARAMSIRCPSAKSTKNAKKLPQTTMYVFTNTKKDDIISAQKYFRNLPKEQMDGEIAENGPVIGPVIQKMK